MKTVLLTNGQQRKTLAAARSLGSRGINIIAAEETRFNPTAFSKYCSKFLVYPSPKETPDKFYEWLRSTIAQYKCDVFFPMDDDTMEVTMGHYEELSKLCSIPVADLNSFKIASDKGESTALAMASGVFCPDTVMPKSLEELESLSLKIRYPAIIKPRKSSGSRGIRVVYNKDELLEEYRGIHEKYPYPIVQDYINLGDKYSVNMIFDREHQIKACYEQKYLRTFPIKNGPSTLTESVSYPEIAEAAKKLMKNLNWYGVVEVEFVIDSNSGKANFMEINPRFWASVQSAIYAGVDFPWLLYKAALGEDVPETFDYKIGSKCRWLLPGDILHFIFNKERMRMNPPFWGNKKYGIKDDIISRDDPMPTLGFLLACFRYIFSIKMWKLMFNR